MKVNFLLSYNVEPTSDTPSEKVKKAIIHIRNKVRDYLDEHDNVDVIEKFSRVDTCIRGTIEVIHNQNTTVRTREKEIESIISVVFENALSDLPKDKKINSSDVIIYCAIMTNHIMEPWSFTGL